MNALPEERPCSGKIVHVPHAWTDEYTDIMRAFERFGLHPGIGHHVPFAYSHKHGHGDRRSFKRYRAGRYHMDAAGRRCCRSPRGRSEEHTSELQSLMRISYAVFCLKK